jgi:hypothetical protein
MTNISLTGNPSVDSIVPYLTLEKLRQSACSKIPRMVVPDHERPRRATNC